MKWHRHNGHSPAYTHAEKVNNSLHNSETFMEKEDNQTVKSLWFCYLKKCKGKNVEEWMKRVRAEAEKCEYQEQDRWIKEKFIWPWWWRHTGENNQWN